MGAGNPSIRSFDDERYHPTTYFLDFTNCYSDEEKQSTLESHLEANNMNIHELSKEEIESTWNLIIEDDVESFISNFFFNLDKPYEELFWWPDKKNRCLSELSASYRSGAIVIAYNKDILIVTTEDSDSHHFALGFVPNFKYDDIWEELWGEHSEKEDWYRARNLFIEDRITFLAEREYERRIKKWRKKYTPFVRWFHSIWKNNMTVRNGAWLSIPLKVIGKDYQFI